MEELLQEVQECIDDEAFIFWGSIAMDINDVRFLFFEQDGFYGLKTLTKEMEHHKVAKSKHKSIIINILKAIKSTEEENK